MSLQSRLAGIGQEATADQSIASAAGFDQDESYGDDDVLVLNQSTSKKKSPEKEGSGSNVHCNPDWVQKLKNNFYIEIIEVCSARTRGAVEKNEYIEVCIFTISTLISKYNFTE